MLIMCNYVFTRHASQVGRTESLLSVGTGRLYFGQINLQQR